MRPLSSLRTAKICLAWGAALLFLPVAAPAAPAEEELLDVEQAFTVSARLRDARTLELTYRIAPGYYLYRKRFKFALSEDPQRWLTARIPPGKMKQDATFGRVETYRDSVRILLPAPSHPGQTGEPGRFELLATSQGCADIGVCYPPHIHRLVFQAGQSGLIVPQASNTPPYSSPPLAGKLLGR